MKSPYPTIICYHKDFEDGDQIYTKMYKTFCRDSNEPMAPSIGMPVWKCNDPKSVKETLKFSDNPIVLLFVDINLICDDGWKHAISYLNSTTTNLLFLPVAVCSEAKEDIYILNNRETIFLKSYNVFDNWKDLIIRIFESSLRFIAKESKYFTDKDGKIKVFISHTKWDEESKIVAENYRQILRRETKLSSFFDVNDVLDGDNFAQAIKDKEKESIVIIFYSQSYSKREWCQKEILAVKEFNIPSILVSMFENEVYRNFPYIGNMPMIRYKEGCWKHITEVLLRQAVRIFYQKAYLSIVEKEIDGIEENKIAIIPNTPEAISLANINSDVSTILYPEPELGRDEKELLIKVRPSLNFITPSTLASGLDLDLKKIAISISVPENLNSKFCGEESLNDVFVEICKNILSHNGRICFGGDLRQNGFAEKLQQLCVLYAKLKDKGEYKKESIKLVENYLAHSYFERISKHDQAKFNNGFIKLVDGGIMKKAYDDNLIRKNDELSLMRKKMNLEVSARIFIGGKFSGFSGLRSGMVDEFLMAMESHYPVFLIGGFGGCTEEIINMIIAKAYNETLFNKAKENTNYKNFVDEKKINPYEQLKTYVVHGFACLNNSLSEEDNYKLAKSNDLVTIINLIFKGLKEL